MLEEARLLEARLETRAAAVSCPVSVAVKRRGATGGCGYDPGSRWQRSEGSVAESLNDEGVVRWQGDGASDPSRSSETGKRG